MRRSGLKTTLVTAAWAAARTRRTYLNAQFVRLKSRRGPKKAILAVAASILTAIYHMLRQEVSYRDLGPDFFETRSKTKVVARYLRKLRDLGCDVEVKHVA